MSVQTLKDSSFRIIGYIETRSDGSLVGKDASFNIKGYYDPGTNVTKDASWRVIGYGNLLTLLITGD